MNVSEEILKTLHNEGQANQMKTVAAELSRVWFQCCVDTLTFTANESLWTVFPSS